MIWEVPCRKRNQIGEGNSKAGEENREVQAGNYSLSKLKMLATPASPLGEFLLRSILESEVLKSMKSWGFKVALQLTETMTTEELSNETFC